MMWEAAARLITEMSGEVLMGCRVIALEFDRAKRVYRVTYQREQGSRVTVEADQVISSAPMRELVNHLSPQLSQEARRAANALRYRDFLVVALMLRDRRLFDDNWIYIHDPGVQVGRIQNFKSWSPEMVPDPAMCCYGMEYFCFEGDGLWASPDEKLIALAAAELEQLGLAAKSDVLDGSVVRSPKAYPVYDDDYARNVGIVRAELARDFPGLHLVGRNGMHKYNNQDHAMMTAMLTVENILAERQLYDVWRVNEDAEYHEAGSAGEQADLSGERLVPARADVR
jgi:protoporphyrinogen oxidase